MITVIQRIPQITIQEGHSQIIVQQENDFPQITVIETLAMTNIVPFSFTATTDGQTTFGNLPGIPTAVVCLFIMGTGQDQVAGDFSVSGLNIVLSGSAPAIKAGDFVFGAISI